MFRDNIPTAGSTAASGGKRQNSYIDESHFSRQENGAALLELTVLLVVMVIIITSAIDLGGMLQRYLIASQVSYEAARTASMIEGLQSAQSTSEIPTKEQLLICRSELFVPQVDPPLPCGLLLANARAMRLLELSNSRLNQSEASVLAAYDGQNTVTFRVSIPSDALFPLFRAVQIRSSTRLPYMSNSEPPRIKRGAL